MPRSIHVPADYPTIPDAVAAAQSGDTISVAPGDYAGGFMTTANGLRYVSETLYGARIVGAGYASGSNAAGWENRGNDVTIEGFEVDGSGSKATDWAFGIYQAGSHVTIRHCEVHDIMTDRQAYDRLTQGGMGGAGIMHDAYYGGTDGNTEACHIYNVGPPGVASTLVHGIYQTEPGTVSNCIVHDIVGDGLTSWHKAKDITFINNTIHQVGGTGVLVGSNEGNAGGGFVVANNIISEAKYGIYEEGTTGRDNVYANNLVHGIAATDIRLQNGLVATGTVKADPRFVNAAGHDYGLQAGSPAIDAGTESPPADFAGTARPQGAAADIGAFEWTEAAPIDPPPAIGLINVLLDPTTGAVTVSGATNVIVE